MTSTTSTYTSNTFAAATATATAAAAATSKSRPSPLTTPLSGTYPSSLQSPSLGTPGYLRRDESLKTPLTPPSAYLDFLKTVPSTLASPSLSTGTTANFFFNNPPASGSPRTENRIPQPPASARPILPSNHSTDSHSSNSSCPDPTIANTGKPLAKTSPPVAPIATPRPASATIPPRRPSVLIPNSGSTLSTILSAGGNTRSPSSAKYKYAPWSATLGPASATESGFDFEDAGKGRPVSIRHVVTRTVTYTRPVAPKPEGAEGADPDEKPTPVKREFSTEPSAEEDESLRKTTMTRPNPRNNISPLLDEAPRGKRRKVDS